MQTFNAGEIIERLKQSFDSKTNDELAKHLDVSKGTIGSWKSRNSIDIKLLIAKCNHVSLDWLLTGKKSGFSQPKKYPVHANDSFAQHVVNESNAISLEKSTDGYASNKKGIPLVSTEAIAGFGNMDFAIQDQDIQNLYSVPDFININFMIRVKGSSMYPKFNSGDVVACRIIRESQFIQWNKVHVLATREQGILIKRLKKGSSPECLCAVSDNKDYDPFEIPTDEITGLAMVIGVIRLE